MVAFTENVLGRLKGLNVDRSPGTDGLCPWVLKKVALEIVEAHLSCDHECSSSGFLIHPKDVQFASEKLSQLCKYVVEIGGNRWECERIKRECKWMLNGRCVKYIIVPELYDPRGCGTRELSSNFCQTGS